MAVGGGVFLAPMTIKPLRFGLLSVADVSFDSSPHWRNGVMVEGDPCVVARYTTDACEPTEAKEAINGYTLFEGEPFTVYALNSCKTVGRMDDAEDRARSALERAETAAVEAAFMEKVLSPLAVDINAGEVVDAKVGVGMLEGYAAANYGGQGILHLPRSLMTPIAGDINAQRNGETIETFLGTPIAAGGGYELNLGPTGAPAAAPGQAWLYVTGDVRLIGSEIGAVPMVIDTTTNDFYALAERTWVPVVDCLVAAILVQLPCCDDCGVTP